MGTSAFRGLQRTDELHFLVNFQAAVFMLIRYLRSIQAIEEVEGEATPDPLDTLLARYPFLGLYLQEMSNYMPDGLTWDEGAVWWRQNIEDWERYRRSYLPLGALTSYADIGFGRRMGLICAGMVEEDARFGDLFDALQPGTQSRRATVEFIGHLILHVDPETADSPRRATQPLIDKGLLVLQDQSAAFAERPVAIPEILWEVFREGADEVLNNKPSLGLRYRSRYQAPQIKHLVFEPEFLEQVRAVPRLLSGNSERLLVVRGAGGSLRGDVVQGIARALRHNSLEIEVPSPPQGQSRAVLAANLAPLIAPLALVTHSVPVLRMEPAPGETVDVPDMPGYSGLVCLVLGRVGGVDAAAVAHAVTLDLPRLGPLEREVHWRKALDEAVPEDMDALVRRFLLPGAHIRSVAGAALAHATIAHRDRVNDADIQSGHHNLNRQYLDNLAAHLDPVGGWSGLVTAGSVTDKLKELEQRCRHREQLPALLGPAFAGTANHGVRALFNGPSGTGKTLAARALAAELGMDLYRVDLAAIVNKYIGETEKNLHQVLSRAEEMDVILLIDEGDALLGKRTDVSSANDRYANLETNYLLQRLESHEGIVLVTTNVGDAIDTAFQRRMDVAVSFVPPRADERLRIWRLHLPENHQVSEEDLADIARRSEFTGGQIRNAAVLATLLALEDNGGQVTAVHLRKAVESEYRKAGALPRSEPSKEQEAESSEGAGVTRLPTTGSAAMQAYINQIRAGKR